MAKIITVGGKVVTVANATSGGYDALTITGAMLDGVNASGGGSVNISQYGNSPAIAYQVFPSTLSGIKRISGILAIATTVSVPSMSSSSSIVITTSSYFGASSSHLADVLTGPTHTGSTGVTTFSSNDIVSFDYFYNAGGTPGYVGECRIGAQGATSESIKFFAHVYNVGDYMFYIQSTGTPGDYGGAIGTVTNSISGYINYSYTI